MNNKGNMKRIAIIGVGLIGGSLGLALRKKAEDKYFVTGIGRNSEKLKNAKKIGAVDACTTDIKGGVKDADIIVICTPVHLIAPMVKRILPFLKPGAFITDAGSVKGSVTKEVNKILATCPLPLATAFVGAHPMAGSEKSGISEAKAGLYDGAVTVLVKGKYANKAALNEIKEIWKTAGAKTIEMTAQAHDRAVALISHLPHVIAFTLCGLAGKLDKASPNLSRLAAGSFKDLTRIAGSNPADWASICSANKSELSEAADIFIKELTAVKHILHNPGALEKRFKKAKTARQKLLYKQDKSQ
jgi:prephenate dehydrogenase